MTARNVSFDYAKGIGIVVVVFAHLWRGMSGSGLLPDVSQQAFWAVSSSCTIWSMPAFFFVSGLLYGKNVLKRHGLKEFAGKFDGIFYPYIIWSVAIGLFEVMGSGYRNGSTPISSLLTILWEPHGIFWFLYALIEAFALSELLVAVFGAKRLQYVALPVALVLLAIWEPRNLFFSLSEFQMSFVYFALGLFFATRIPVEQRPSGIRAALSFLAIPSTLYIGHIVLGIKTESFRSVTPNATALAVVVLCLFIFFCYSLPATRLNWLANLGSRSMDIYLIHLLIIAPIRIALHKFGGITNPLIYVVVALPLGIIGSLFLADILRKLRFNWMFSPPRFLSAKAWLSKAQ